LVVLPFENFSGNPEEQYFADGLTEEVIAQLSRIDPRHLGVIARMSAMRYANTNKSLREIGEELKVDYILEGSVRRFPERVRVTAQLIQVHDLTHVWADSYDRTSADLLAVQCDVAERTASSILREIIPDSPASGRNVNRDAYDLYLHGRFLWNQRTEAGLQ